MFSSLKKSTENNSSERISLKKWIELIILIGIILIAGDHFLRKKIIMPNFLQLEEEEAHRNLSRVLDAIEREVHHLKQLNGDWAKWDDTYNFVNNRNKEFIKANIEWESLENVSDINLIYIINNRGDVVFGETFNSSLGGIIKLKYFNKKKIELNNRILPGKNDSKSGLMLTERGILLISSMKIQRSNVKGDSNGILVMGRFLKKKTINTLKEHTRVSFSVIELSTSNKTKKINNTITLLKKQKVKISKKENQLKITTTIKDINSEPIMLIMVDMDRKLVERGYSVARFASATLLITIIIASIFLTAAFSITIRVLKKRKTEIEKIVQIRTQEYEVEKYRAEDLFEKLAKKNNHLRKEIESRKKAEKKLVKLATIDDLTGLINRRHFIERSNIEMKRAKRYKKNLSLLMIDADFFKKINDTYGHQTGDKVLKKIAKCLKSVCRETDICSRIGGEEFAVLLVESELVDAKKIAERFHKIIRESSVKSDNNQTVSFTVSIGIAGYNKDKTPNLDTLLSFADKALYTAKRDGRNRTYLSNG